MFITLRDVRDRYILPSVQRREAVKILISTALMHAIILTGRHLHPNLPICQNMEESVN